MNQEERVKELNIEALTDNLPQVMELVDNILEEVDCPFKIQTQIDLAVEEIFVNIAKYAYTECTGMALVRAGLSESKDEISITFIDSGIPYNPLEREDPDVTLSAEERKIGGLGVFLTKKFMDDVAYEYKDGKNILKLVKKLN